MSKEKTDEFLSWRGRLDQPDALPEQSLGNHEASWQRLAERLHEKPRRRVTGYWVAAACLLLVLIPAIRLFHPRPPATAFRTQVPVTRHTSVGQQAFVEKVAAKPLPVVYSAPSRPVVRHHRRPSAVLVATAPSNGTPATSRTGSSLLSSAAPPAITVPDIKPATDSHQLIARLPAVKKQLKVVYYNELSNPSAPSPSTAARTPGFLKFSLERFGSPTTAGDQEAQPNNDPALTIKLIPKNN